MFNVIIKKGNQVIQKIIDAKKVIFALGNPIYLQENLGVTQVYAYDILSPPKMFFIGTKHMVLVEALLPKYADIQRISDIMRNAIL